MGVISKDCRLLVLISGVAFFKSWTLAAECSLEKKKECPGLHESHDQVACCPSKVETGDFYCCTLEEKRLSEYSWHVDLLESSGEIIGGVIAILVVVGFLVLLCCFFCERCYLYKYRHRTGGGHGSPWRNPLQSNNDGSRESSRSTNVTQPLIGAAYLQSYQPVPVTEPKPYDAPPPYLVAQQYPAFNPSGLTSTIVIRNNTDCMCSSPLRRHCGGGAQAYRCTPKVV